MLPLIPSNAVVVNATVTGTRALTATRSPAAMVNTTPVGCVDIEQSDMLLDKHCLSRNIQLMGIQGQEGVLRQNPTEGESSSEYHTPPASKQAWQLEHILKLEEEQGLEHLLLVEMLQSQPNDQVSPKHVLLTELHEP